LQRFEISSQVRAAFAERLLIQTVWCALPAPYKQPVSRSDHLGLIFHYFNQYPAQTTIAQSPRIESGLRLQLRIWLPALACLMVFAVESTSYLGGDRTSEPLRRIAESIFGYDACVNWNPIHHIIRKVGHFIGYGCFALVCFRAFWMTARNTVSRLSRQLRAHGLAILAVFLVASADEIHQSFLPNRFGQFSDVLLDTCGAVVCCFMLYLAMQAVEFLRRMRSHSFSGQQPSTAEASA
jgi:VanZ family protein